MPTTAMTAPSRKIRVSRCRGADPMASRMPNSRVRALTENARTPATPTTAIVSATAANPPKTSAFNRSGASTSALMSSSVAGRSTGCSGDELANDARDLRHERVGVGAGMDEDAAAANFLLERVIDAQRRTRNDVLIVDVGGDTDDAAWLGLDVDELHHRIGPHQAAVDRVARAEHAPRHALADDDDRLGIATIGVGEITAGDDRHTKRAEEARRYRAESCPRIFFAVRLRIPLDRELESRAERAGIAPRHDRADGGLLDARQLRDAAAALRCRRRRLAPAAAYRRRAARSARERCSS